MPELLQSLKEDSVLDFNISFKELLEAKLQEKTSIEPRLTKLHESTDYAYLNADYGDYKSGTKVEILDCEKGVYKIKFPDGEKDSMVKSLLDFKSDDEEDDD